MTVLTPSCAVTLADQRFTDQVLAVNVLLAAAPLVGSAMATLPAGSPLSATPGDPAKVELDGGDGGGLTTVLTGTVTAVRRDPSTATVTVVDGAGLLARFRPATTYEKVSAGTVIGNLAGDAGVDTGQIDDGVALAWYAADPARTALDHVTRLAGWSGALARVDAEGRLVATAVAATQAEIALRYGREVVAVTQAGRLRDVEAFTVAGEAGAGDTSSPDALRPTSDFFAGDRPDGPDGTHRWSFAPALRTTGAAATAGAAASWRYRSGARLGTLTAFLQPALRPGTALEIADLPDPLSGAPVWLDRVRHGIDPTGAVTSARMYTGGPPPTGGPGLLAGAATALRAL